MNDIAPLDDTAEMTAYMRDGERRALSLGNRGPARFNENGRLDDAILDAYWRCGFYIFEGVLGIKELGDIKADFNEILDRLPTHKDSKM